MEKEIMALTTTTPSQAAAPPSKNEPESGGGGGTWSPLFDGIVKETDEEEIMDVDDRINSVLYGGVKRRGRLPVFEEISPSTFDFHELRKMFDPYASSSTEDNDEEEF